MRLRLSADRAWLPVGLVLGLLAGYLFTYHFLVLCQWDACQTSAAVQGVLSGLVAVEPSTEIAAYAPRLLWVTSVGASLLVPLLCIGTGVACLATLDPRHSRRWTILAATFAIVGLPFFLSRAGNPGHPWRHFLHPALLADTPAASFIHPLLDVLAFLTTIIMACVAAALVSEATAAGAGKSLDSLIRARAWLGLLLYLSAGQLVVSLLRLRFFLSWSLAYIPPTDQDSPVSVAALVSSLNQIASTIVTTQAIFYTGLLVALFLPVIRIIHSAGDQLVASSGTEMPARLLDEWPRGTKWESKLPKLLALLAPLLSGLIGELIKGIS